MANPTRYSRIGLSGRRGETNKTDAFIETLVAPIAHVASAAQQDTGIPIPNNMQAIRATLHITTIEESAVTKTVDVGLFGGGEDFFISAVTADVAGFKGKLNNNGTLNGGGTIGFTLAGADFAELEGEIIIHILGAD